MLQPALPAAGHQTPGLTLSGIRKEYAGITALHAIDFEAKNGEFIVILGPSGCGKSTLLRVIAGLEDIQGGTITINGKEVTHQAPRNRDCAMVFQSYALYPHLSVADNIGYPLRIAGVARSERRRLVEETARIVDLLPYLDRKPANLSGGQRQRVAMARAIIRRPALFLFDEPLSNLDARLRVIMRAEIRQLQERLKVTAIFVTHDQVEAMTMADRIIVMRAGKIEQVGTPSDIYERPASRYVAEFVGGQPMSFLQGEITATGDAVVLSNQARIPLVEPMLLPAGTRVDVGLRAETVQLHLAPGPRTFSARFRFSEYLGAAKIHHTTVDEVEVLSFDSTCGDIRDPNVHLEIEGSKIHLFDRESGVRLN